MLSKGAAPRTNRLPSYFLFFPPAALIYQYSTRLPCSTTPLVELISSGYGQPKNSTTSNRCRASSYREREWSSPSREVNNLLTLRHGPIMFHNSAARLRLPLRKTALESGANAAEISGKDRPAVRKATTASLATSGTTSAFRTRVDLIVL